jgi:hypothetical protein
MPRPRVIGYELSLLACGREPMASGVVRRGGLQPRTFATSCCAVACSSASVAKLATLDNDAPALEGDHRGRAAPHLRGRIDEAVHRGHRGESLNRSRRVAAGARRIGRSQCTARIARTDQAARILNVGIICFTLHMWCRCAAVRTCITCMSTYDTCIARQGRERMRVRRGPVVRADGQSSTRVSLRARSDQPRRNHGDSTMPDVHYGINEAVYRRQRVESCEAV